jgi:hypothetical protein
MAKDSQQASRITGFFQLVFSAFGSESKEQRLKSSWLEPVRTHRGNDVQRIEARVVTFFYLVFGSDVQDVGSQLNQDKRLGYQAKGGMRIGYRGQGTGKHNSFLEFTPKARL